MKKIIFVFIAVFVSSSLDVFSQTALPTPTPTRPRILATPTPTPNARVIMTDNLPAPVAIPVPRPAVVPLQTPIIVAPNQPVYPNALPAPTPLSPTFYKPLSFVQIKSKIAEAKRQMLARPIPTAMTDNFLLNNIVRIAFYDYKTDNLDYIVMSKDSFLAKDGQIFTTTTNGKQMIVKILRVNGVNTPIMIVDTDNKAHLPLLVQYPVVRNDVFQETAYYISTHPGITTPEVVNAGRIYVRNIIDTARDNLQKKGIFIAPQVADMAERLSIVEHVDHLRFKTEYQRKIYDDIYSLYALNEGQTYRYSVSSAGAGGMVQMIPATYQMVRSRYYSVGLMSDFVEGMRNHPNAATVMLLYMQMTWNDLLASPTIYDAIENGIATPAELMSAGYNSNPAKLAGYIKRGGANWRNLIPRETQIYLQINASMDKFEPVLPRTK